MKRHIAARRYANDSHSRKLIKGGIWSGTLPPAVTQTIHTAESILKAEYGAAHCRPPLRKRFTQQKVY